MFVVLMLIYQYYTNIFCIKLVSETVFNNNTDTTCFDNK